MEIKDNPTEIEKRTNQLKNKVMKISKMFMSIFLLNTNFILSRHLESQDLEKEIKLLGDKKAQVNLTNTKKKVSPLSSQRPQKPRIKRSGTREGKNMFNKK